MRLVTKPIPAKQKSIRFLQGETIEAIPNKEARKNYVETTSFRINNINKMGDEPVSPRDNETNKCEKYAKELEAEVIRMRTDNEIMSITLKHL
jgi:hypothetical protein